MTDRSSLSTDPTAEILSEMRWFRAVPKRTCTLRWLAPWFSVSDYITSGEVTQGIQGLRLLEPATVRHLRLSSRSGKLKKTETIRTNGLWTKHCSSSKDVASIVSQLSGNLFVSHSWYTDPRYNAVCPFCLSATMTLLQPRPWLTWSLMLFPDSLIRSLYPYLCIS